MYRKRSCFQTRLKAVFEESSSVAGNLQNSFAKDLTGMKHLWALEYRSKGLGASLQ